MHARILSMSFHRKEIVVRLVIWQPPKNKPGNRARGRFGMRGAHPPVLVNDFEPVTVHPPIMAKLFGNTEGEQHDQRNQP
jgi:hypothetical protein